MIRRRDFLGFALASGLAGCTSLLESDQQLGGILVFNGERTEHEVEVEVIRNDETVHTSVNGLEPREEDVADSSVVNCDWPTESGHFVIRARAEQIDWVSVDLSEENGNGYYQVYINIPPEFSDDLLVTAVECREESDWLCDHATT